jgi:predicted DsbA family dithiol-disulfide isomerase
MTHLETPAVLKSVGLTQADLTECMADPETEKLVEADIAQATRAETKGTPNFVILGPNNVQLQIPGLPKPEILQAIINRISE